MNENIKQLFCKVIQQENLKDDKELIAWIDTHRGYLNYEQALEARKIKK